MKKILTLSLTFAFIISACGPASAFELKTWHKVLASFALPGAGELMDGKYISGLTFLAIEGAAIYCYADFTSRGADIRNRFIGYAAANAGASPGQPDSYYEAVGEADSDTMYEVLRNKNYDYPLWQWNGRDDLRGVYYDMRQESNLYYKKAGTSAGVVLINHFAGALFTYIRLKKDGRLNAGLERFGDGSLLYITRSF